jgi:hypothetical protein
MKKKYFVKAVVPATVVRIFEVEASNEEEALAEYLKGESYEIEEATTTTHDKDVVFEVIEEFGLSEK